jgi:LruC domain-containing protein
MEVHLPDMPPTFNANTEFFNNEDDDSNPASGRYYKTAINLPWAINIPSQWSYPIERISIIQAYNFFDEWAESSGTERTDWYENSGNNTVEENLFPNP